MPSYRNVLLSLAALTSLACGASYQRIYEGDVRFEHCYRLDADPAVSPQARLSCWSEWSRNHTPGQTLDRVAYARRREEALRSGQTSLTGPSLVTGIAAPTATQAFALRADSAPPTGTTAPTFSQPAHPPAPQATAALAPTAPPAASALSSRQQCSNECGQGFTVCVTRCELPSCLQKCGNQAKACLDLCL